MIKNKRKPKPKHTHTNSVTGFLSWDRNVTKCGEIQGFSGHSFYIHCFYFKVFHKSNHSLSDKKKNPLKSVPTKENTEK